MDFDCVETAEEAVFLLHTEHFDCQCEICRKVRGKYDLSTLSNGSEAEKQRDREREEKTCLP